MSSRVTRFWTLNSLVGAFLDLSIAYFLLCGSTIAFFAGKFLSLFGLSLLSPCNGLFGIPNSDFTSLLVDYPIDKISTVQFSVSRKFPFDSIFFGIQNCNANKGLNLEKDDGNGDGFRELEGEASCSSKSDARKVLRNETDDSGVGIERERGFDMKGKGVVSYRVRGGFRRRRKGSLDSGKHSSVSSSPTWITCVDQPSNHKEHRGGLEGSSILSGANSCNYEAETPMVVKSEDGYDHDSVFDEPGNRIEAKERIALDDDDKDNTISLLARELEEEQAARAALCVELDKERNAAATAADEAMAMILRLQEEKASIEMESRQYQRMIEEKSSFDEEEMNILKEILLRREREKHFLEKEVEAYRQIIGLENDQFYGGNIQDFTEDPDLMLHQLSMSLAKRKNSRSFEDVDLLKNEDINKQFPEKTIAIVGKEQRLDRKAGDVSHGNKELCSQLGETKLDVYDVNVIDDKPRLSDKSNGNKNQQPSVGDIDGVFLQRLDKESDQNRRSSEMAVGLPPMSSKNSRRNSTSALDNERTRIDTEVEWLRERLRIVQEGREKLNLSMDHREKETLQLQLLEDITRQLQEIRMLTEPRKTRQASLPLPSSKGLTKKRRCRSVSSGPAKSS